MPADPSYAHSLKGRPVGQWHVLEEHLVETAKLAETFASKIGLSSLGYLMGLLHDAGKYSSTFQEYLKSAENNLEPDDEGYVVSNSMKGKIDHSSAGAQYLWEGLKDGDKLQLLAAQIMSLCIASHHGKGLIDCLAPDGTDFFSKRMAKSKDKTHLDEIRTKVDKSIYDSVEKVISSSSTTTINELKQRLELLFSNEQSREIREFGLGLLVRFLLSTLIDADRMDTANSGSKANMPKGYDNYPEWKVLVEILEAHLANLKARNKVDEIRTAISLSCMSFAQRDKGLYQLTVPTGGGKTLASLRFALHHAKQHRMERIVYVVPYTSIIDQNAANVRSILETPLTMKNGLVVLEHHSNLTSKEDTQINKTLSENWDAPIVFTTAVQFFETLFAAGTRGVRRMHRLANAVIIFDEIQTIPIKTVHLFNNAINFLVGQCGATALFCTATQPLLDEVDASKGAARFSDNHKVITDEADLFKTLRRVEVIDKRKAGGWPEGEVAKAILKKMNEAGSVLVIVNTKAQARQMYRRCRYLAKNVCHLSTSMCPAHRMHVLNTIKESLNPNRPKPLICVSTQLIEAGVDVDFGAVIRYLAGLDSIAQAAGRCNRNGLRSSGEVFIVNPANENLDTLPDIQIAKEKAERVLDEFRKAPSAFDNDLLSPKAMKCYYDYYFHERRHEMDYPVSSKEVGRADTLLSLLSTNNRSVAAYMRNNQKKAPPLFLRQSFKTAAELFEVISAPTEGVIVPYEDGIRIIDEMANAHSEDKYNLLKQAQRYSVNLFPYEMEKLKMDGGIHEVWEGSGVWYLDSIHYSDEFGVSIEPVIPVI